MTSFEALAYVAVRNPDFHPRSSTLDPPASIFIAAWIDAHRGEVFASLYAPDAGVVGEPPTALPPEKTLDAWARRLENDARIQFVGNGAVRYADIIRARFGERAAIATRPPALAAAVGLIAAADPGRAVAPHALVPFYVRRPDVELVRDRRQAAKP